MRVVTQKLHHTLNKLEKFEDFISFFISSSYRQSNVVKIVLLNSTRPAAEGSVMFSSEDCLVE